MIVFSCQVCGKQIKVDEKFAGKKGKCSGCGQVLIVPSASAKPPVSVAAAPSAPAAAASAPPPSLAKPTQPVASTTTNEEVEQTIAEGSQKTTVPAHKSSRGLVWSICAFLGLLVGAYLISQWAGGGSWEKANGDRIRELRREMSALISQSKHKEARAKFKELQDLVGKRVLKDDDLRNTYNEALAEFLVKGHSTEENVQAILEMKEEERKKGIAAFRCDSKEKAWDKAMSLVHQIEAVPFEKMPRYDPSYVTDMGSDYSVRMYIDGTTHRIKVLKTGQAVPD